MSDSRYSRNEGLFGKEGQQRITETAVAVAGTGGLGMPVIQQLAYLGTSRFAGIDPDIVTESSLNRLVGATDDDVQVGNKKVAVAERLVREVNPGAQFHAYDGNLEEPAAYELFRAADVIFGCLDDDHARLKLNRIAAELDKPYFDLATDIGEDGEWWGGHVVLSDGSQCLVCLGVLDLDELARADMSSEQIDAHDRIYGVNEAALAGTGPMVVSINGGVASIAVTEFMALVTGIREPKKHLRYRADQQVIRASGDEPSPGCYFCEGVRTKR
jgi:molybdopterin-synthase adenylyltransferase